MSLSCCFGIFSTQPVISSTWFGFCSWQGFTTFDLYDLSHGRLPSRGSYYKSYGFTSHINDLSSCFVFSQRNSFSLFLGSSHSLLRVLNSVSVSASGQLVTVNKFKWHLDLRIKCSCLRIFENLLAKNSVYNFQKTYDYQSAMECSVCRVAISKPYQELFLLWAANKLFQGSQDSPRGAKNFFRESQNSPRETNS